MNPELEMEILELMESKNISYDEAHERYFRRLLQMELACDRQNAQKAKDSVTKQKQKKFQQAAQDNN